MTLENLKNRVRLILDDAGVNRYSDETLESAARLAMRNLDERLPQVLTSELEITTSGRDQSLSGMQNCLYLMDLAVRTTTPSEREEPLKAEFSYTLENGSLNLHFSGVNYPQAGQTLKVRCAARNTLQELEEATTTTLPDGAAAALEFGTAGYACLLRAAALSEAYGARPGESTRLGEQGRLWLEQSSAALNGIKSTVEYGYPQGFELDRWDEEG